MNIETVLDIPLFPSFPPHQVPKICTWFEANVQNQTSPNTLRSQRRIDRFEAKFDRRGEFSAIAGVVDSAGFPRILGEIEEQFPQDRTRRSINHIVLATLRPPRVPLIQNMGMGTIEMHDQTHHVLAIGSDTGTRLIKY